MSNRADRIATVGNYIVVPSAGVAAGFSAGLRVAGAEVSATPTRVGAT